MGESSVGQQVCQEVVDEGAGATEEATLTTTAELMRCLWRGHCKGWESNIVERFRPEKLGERRHCQNQCGVRALA